MAGSDDPHEAQTIWEAPDGSQWRLSFYVKRVDGRPECVGLDIRPQPYPFAAQRERPLRSSHLRFPFAAMLARAQGDEASARRRARLMDLGRRLGGDVSALAEEASVMVRDDGLKSGKHAKYTRADLERVATAYRSAWSGDDNMPPSRSPTRDVADKLGIPYNQAAKLVQRCRGLGLLPPTAPGVARGSTEED